MYFYVDGDNCPGNRTIGLDKLKHTDVVKVFYAANNKHYCQEAVRKELISRATCRVEFISVKPCANAVDFIIAVHIAKDCESRVSGDVVCMVSGDKHFDIIKCELVKLYNNIAVNRVETIEEGVMRYYMFDIDSIDMFEKTLQQQYGKKKGEEIYNKISDMFMKNIYPVTSSAPEYVNPVLRLFKKLA